MTRPLFFKKWANPGLFSFIFGLCKQTLQIFTTNRCEKMSLQYTVQDSNPHPSECESLPITTRPGLPCTFLSQEMGHGALFCRRRWTTGSAQQSNNYGIMPCTCCITFFGFNINAFCLGRSSLHLLILKSSMDGQKTFHNYKSMLRNIELHRSEFLTSQS